MSIWWRQGLAVSGVVALAAGLALTDCVPVGKLDRSTDRRGEREGSVTLMVLPDDGAGGLLDAVAGARRRVWMEMYLLTDDRAVGALQTARAAGADVRVLLEPKPYGEETANQPAFATLARTGIDVRWFLVPEGLVHAKVVLVDDAAWISTANLTSAGLDRNREMMAVDDDPVDVQRVESMWEADAIGWSGAGMPGMIRSAKDTNEAREIRVIASPEDARARLTAVVDGATSTIELEVEEISDGDFMARLIAARARGVAVSVVVPAGGDRSASTTAATTRLGGAGVDVRATGGPHLHAKALAADGRIAYLGSVNFTRASFDDNREVGLLLEDPPLVARIRDTILRDGSVGTTLP
jgi:phosphatidylserine/phosphatidylglycerophosphate/cardiolipin synthase-like enzyme